MLSKESKVEGMQEMIPFEQQDSSTSIIKYGSLQELISFDGECSDYSYTKFKTDNVHQIALLDIRILNCDRNEGNILVKERSKGEYELVPIDHGLSMPDSLLICDYEICWTMWPQIQKPLSEKSKNFVLSLDPKKNYVRLKKLLKFRDVLQFYQDMSKKYQNSRNFVGTGCEARHGLATNDKNNIQIGL